MLRVEEIVVKYERENREGKGRAYKIVEEATSTMIDVSNGDVDDREAGQEAEDNFAVPKEVVAEVIVTD